MEPDRYYYSLSIATNITTSKFILMRRSVKAEMMSVLTMKTGEVKLGTPDEGSHILYLYHYFYIFLLN